MEATMINQFLFLLVGVIVLAIIIGMAWYGGARASERSAERSDKLVMTNYERMEVIVSRLETEVKQLQANNDQLKQELQEANEKSRIASEEVVRLSNQLQQANQKIQKLEQQQSQR